jgi:hypothetical protein
MKLRQYKSNFFESMATIVEIEPTRKAVLEAVRSSGLVNKDLAEDRLIIQPYAANACNGFREACVVVISNWGIYGYTDDSVDDS